MLATLIYRNKLDFVPMVTFNHLNHMQITSQSLYYYDFV